MAEFKKTRGRANTEIWEEASPEFKEWFRSMIGESASWPPKGQTQWEFFACAWDAWRAGRQSLQ